MKFSRILVTGGAGFVGHRLVRELAARKIAVAVIDNLFVKMPMPERSAHVDPYEVDIRDIAAVDRVFAEFKPDAIVHLAAVHHIPTCERNPHLAMDVNVVGTQVILDAAEKHGVKHLVLASSAAVYDFVESALVEDETPLRATDVYSTTKLTNENQVTVWQTRCNGNAVLARIFNVIGHDDPNGHLIPDILNQLGIENGRVTTPVVSLGNLEPKRDYTHADDTARGLVAILEYLGTTDKPVEAFNLSFGHEYPVTELVRIIGEYFGCELEIRRDPARVRRVDRLHLLGDPKKTAGTLNWAARRSLAEAMNDILGKLAPRPA